MILDDAEGGAQEVKQEVGDEGVRGGNRHEEKKEEEGFVFSTQVAPAGTVLLRKGGESVSSLLLVRWCRVQECNKLCGTPPPLLLDQHQDSQSGKS